MHYLQSIDLAREYRQALLAEAAHEQLLQEALQSCHCGSRPARSWSLRTALHRASTALGFAPLPGARAA